MPAFCYTCKKYHKLDQAVKAHRSDVLDSPFVPLMTRAFEMGRELSDKKRLEERGTLDQETMYLSQAGNECLKQAVWARQNHPVSNPLDIWSLMNFEVGDAVQAALARVLTHLGGTLIEEHHVEVPHGGSVATGRSDFLLDIPKEVITELGLDGTGVDENNLIEVKATGESAMVNLIGNGQHGRQSHRDQLNQYLHASHLGLMPGGRVYDRAWLIYHVPLQPKGQPNIFPFEIGYSPARAIGNLDWLMEAERMALAGETPDIPASYIQSYEKKGKVPVFPCEYCQFEDDCWKEVRQT